MYNSYLDAFRAVAENNSFSKAADKLFMSHTSVMKQVNQLETKLEVKLFKRSSHGVTLTEAGRSFYKDTLKIMHFSEEAIQRARDAEASSVRKIRIGNFFLYPCRTFLELWEGMEDSCPQFKLQIVNFHDDEEYYFKLDGSCDIVIGPYSAYAEKPGLQFIPVGQYRFCLTLPRRHPLAKKKVLSFQDLDHQHFMIMQRGTSPVNDKIRQDILDTHLDITIEDIPPDYNTQTFNRCAESNAVLLSLECWEQMHPMLVNIPLEPTYLLPYGMIVSREPSGDMQEFLSIVQNHLNQYEGQGS